MNLFISVPYILSRIVVNFKKLRGFFTGSSNQRQKLLKQRTLLWRFDIEHLPGKTNYAADAASRHPSPTSAPPGSSSLPDITEVALMASIQADVQERGTFSWSLLAQETTTDACLGHLLSLMEQGGSIDLRDPALARISPVCESIYAYDGVLLYDDHMVVPTSLCRKVLHHLHAAYQGTSAMEQHALAIEIRE